MKKDWNYYKELFMQEEINEIENKFDLYEKTISSPIERIVWMFLVKEFEYKVMNGDMSLERQKQIGKYKADIYVEYYSRTNNSLTKIVIECDGHDFHEKTKKQAAHDKQRDRFMTLENYIVLRYTGSEIVSNPDIIIDDVYELILKQRS